MPEYRKQLETLATKVPTFYDCEGKMPRAVLIENLRLADEEAGRLGFPMLSDYGARPPA